MSNYYILSPLAKSVDYSVVTANFTFLEWNISFLKMGFNFNLYVTDTSKLCLKFSFDLILKLMEWPSDLLYL